MEIKSVNAPALSQEGIKRLLAFCTPQRMTPDCTLFAAGYEQAKRDFKEKIFAEIGIPAAERDDLEQIAKDNTRDEHIRSIRNQAMAEARKSGSIWSLFR